MSYPWYLIYQEYFTLILIVLLLEDFASEIELTEEEQIKLLEQYEQEKKDVKQRDKINKTIGEKILFTQESPKKKLEKNIDRKIVDKSVVNLDTPSSNSSTDGDWEKITEIEKWNLFNISQY